MWWLLFDLLFYCRVKNAAKTSLTATSSPRLYPNGHLKAKCDSAVTQMLERYLNKWSNNSDHYFSTFFNVTISEVNIKNLHECGEKYLLSIHYLCICSEVSVFPYIEGMPEPLPHGIVWAWP